ncbi:MAG TPA: DUF1579 family protein [Bacteroidota bacterium]|nr:DUF1579 family protein [Bacteroidota bacterium]
MKTLLPVTLLIFTLSTALGQGNTPATRTVPAKVEIPREHLAFLVGTFTTEMHILPGRIIKTESVGKGITTISWTLDSMFLFIDEKSQNSALGSYKAMGFLGFDPREQQYVLSMYNNFGDEPVYRGTFSGDTLVLAAKIPGRGKPFDQQVRWYTAGGDLHLDALNDTGEGYLRVMREVLTPAREGK